MSVDKFLENISDLNTKVTIEEVALSGGNEAQIYRGIYTSGGIDKDVAIRVLHSKDPASVNAEVRLAASVESPFVLRIIDWGYLMVNGESKLVEILPLLDGNLLKFADVLLERDFANILYQSYKGFMSLAKANIEFSVEEMFPSQILLANTNDKDNLIVKIGDFGSWRPLRDENFTGYSLSKFLEIVWSVVARQDATSNNHLGIYNLNSLFIYADHRKVVLNKRYKTIFPKNVLVELIKLGNSNLPSKEYLDLADRVFTFIAKYYNLNQFFI